MGNYTNKQNTVLNFFETFLYFMYSFNELRHGDLTLEFFVIALYPLSII
jgi:hypothetical protein